MSEKEDQIHILDELDGIDKSHITEIFFDDIVPKLNRIDARIGTLNCDFAGDQYKNWNITFKSKGQGFEIIDFEYDADSYGFCLDT
jgi:hypothetical protein